MKKIVMLLIQFYRLFISPIFPPRCRFQPTCSQYALTAIERFGLVVGGTMATRRILSCHPWHIGGYDPVPEASLTDTLQVAKISTCRSCLHESGISVTERAACVTEMHQDYPLADE